ncbi:MAG: endopeptidase La [Eubacteriales bacterium]|nr:endopeptidase La [Eubacteriales bacterium]
MNVLKTLPLVALRGLTLFPHMALHFDIRRAKSLSAVEKAMFAGQDVFLCSQKSADVKDPSADDICLVGTLAKIKQLLKLPDGNMRVLVEGRSRVVIQNYLQTDPYFEAEGLVIDETEYETDSELTALIRLVSEEFDNYIKVTDKISPDVHNDIASILNPGHFADVIAANVIKNQKEKQAHLERLDVKQRLESLYTILLREIDILTVEQKITSRVRTQIDKSQKEYYLREQIKAISKELGEDEDEIHALRERIDAAGLPEAVHEKAVKEYTRLSRMPAAAPEAPMIRAYIDLLLELPWTVKTVDNTDLQKSEAILNDEHYGLEKVKDRILEYLAVCHLKKNMKGPILCFVGPPGVGKTSIATSIAHALGRKFVRMSLGGVHDEAEIRGHRRTYIGAIPGRILAGMKTAGTVNPVFLLDEIDKMGNDFRGDPASAMLEVLDSNQNNTFRDHYLEMPYDLSNVLFIATANTTETIPRPLMDRMEIITLSSYTEEEKLMIAKRHLLPKQLAEHGLNADQLKIPADVMRSLINHYTREAGVRSLERQIGAVCRKAARKLTENGDAPIRMTQTMLTDYLGPHQYEHDHIGKSDQIGVVTGLAWTSVGGETLNVEVVTMPGSGEVNLTGQLGDVMKESARAALSFIRANSDNLGLDKDFYKNIDVHIHVPEGAVPKDGPSAGITIATAMVSAFTGIPVRKDVAMTGEITLTGSVLPIGGLKEKVLAAKRCGVNRVIIPSDNKRDLADIPENIRSKIEFITASDIHTVLHHALVRRPEKKNVSDQKSKSV